MHGQTRQPLVSVIAVSLNHERWVRETLESIRQQTCRDVEVIYCDDASGDRSVAIATDWLEKSGLAYKTMLRNRSGGICRVLNDAVALSEGKYLQVISCDDRLLPQKLQIHTEVLESAPEQVAAVYSDGRIIGAAGNVRTPFRFSRMCGVRFPLVRPLYTRLLKGNCIPAMSVLIKKEVVIDLGGFDESLQFEDWDMWLRVTRRHEMIFDPYVSIEYRLHSSNFHRRLNPNQTYWILKKHSDHEEGRRCMIHAAARSVARGFCTELERADFCQTFFGEAGGQSAEEFFVALMEECQEVRREGSVAHVIREKMRRARAYVEGMLFYLGWGTYV